MSTTTKTVILEDWMQPIPGRGKRSDEKSIPTNHTVPDKAAPIPAPVIETRGSVPAPQSGRIGERVRSSRSAGSHASGAFPGRTTSADAPQAVPGTPPTTPSLARVTQPRIRVRRPMTPPDPDEERRIHEEIMGNREAPIADRLGLILSLSGLGAFAMAQEMELSIAMTLQAFVLCIPVILLALLALRAFGELLPAFDDLRAASVVVAIMVGIAAFSIFFSERTLGQIHNPDAARASSYRP